jgi:DNA-binding transcriptional LysR family regulator
MNDLQIKYFLGIVNNDINFTKASKVLFVSQPALSKHINTLEKELGVKLFNTSVKSSIRLTLAGEHFYRFFSEYMREMAKAVREAKWANNQPSGEIKISVPNGWNLSALSQKFAAFQSQYPNIAFYIHSAGFKEIEGGIQKNNYDLAITPSFHLEAIKEMENICVREICTIPIICLYSSRHTLAAKNDLTIADFKDDVLYTLSTEETPLAWTRSEAYCNSKGFVPKIKTVPNIDSILLALERGSGYTLFDQWHRIKDHPSFRYIHCDISDTVCAVWKKDNPNTVLNLFVNQCLLDLNAGDKC